MRTTDVIDWGRCSRKSSRVDGDGSRCFGGEPPLSLRDISSRAGGGKRRDSTKGFDEGTMSSRSVVARALSRSYMRWRLNQDSGVVPRIWRSAGQCRRRRRGRHKLQTDEAGMDARLIAERRPMLRAVAEPEAIERLASQIKESPMGEVRVPVRVANPDAPDRNWEAEFLVDTGATCRWFRSTCSMTGRRSDRRGPLLPRRRVVDSARVGLARFVVAGVSRHAEVMFGDEGCQPIVGSTLLQSMGFLVDPLHSRASVAAFRAHGLAGLARQSEHQSI